MSELGRAWGRVATSARGRRLFAVFAAVLVVLGVTVPQATAAPPYTTTATITSVDFTTTEVDTGDLARLDLTWSLPDYPETPAGLVVDFPAELVVEDQTFSMAAPGGGSMGTCTVSANSAYCDIDADYLAAHPINISGTFYVWVRVTTEVTTTTETTWNIGGQTATLKVSPPTTYSCEPDCSYQGNSGQKFGRIKDGQLHWTVVVPVGPDGMQGGEQVYVNELIGANQVVTSMVLRKSTTLMENSYDGRLTPVNFQEVDPSGYTIEGSKLSFTAEAGGYYQVLIVADATDDFASTTYRNSVEFGVGTEEVKTVSGTAKNYGGGATGLGEGVGAFRITKSLDGDGAELAAASGVTYTVNYTVTLPDETTQTGSATLSPAVEWTSPSFPQGSTVHLSEVVPTQPAGISWGTPEFSTNDFTLEGGSYTILSLTNTATLEDGQFSVVKSVSGDAASLVPAETEFSVDYSYPAGDGFEAGSGSLTVLADGNVVTSDALPFGAVVTLSEVDLPAIAGVTWGTPKFSGTGVADNGDGTATLTIGGSVVAVTLTNSASLQSGQFSVVKSVSGDAASLVPAETEFSVDYSYPAGDGFEAGSGSLTVLADGNVVTSDALPFGAVVTLSEVDLPAIAGVTWGTPKFSGTGVADNGDGTATLTIGGSVVAVTLTNSASLQSGQFSVVKSVSGDAASLVPAETEFSVDYSYPAGDGFEAGSGSLTVLADGNVVTSDALPFGAVVTLSEVDLPAIAGVTWGTPTFSPETVTIGADTVVEVQLSNTALGQSGYFSVAKKVVGDGAALVPSETAFSVAYSYPAGATFEAGSGSLTVLADGNVVTSDALPYGAVVSLEEVDLPAVAGVEWGAASFSPDTVTIGNDTTVAVELTNTATLMTSGFSVSKTVAGTAADLVPSETEFTVEYSYPAGTGFEAGSGTLTVLVDGSVVTTDELPYGAVVTLSESELPMIDGVEWGTPVFSGDGVTDNGDGTASFMVTDGASVSVALENTASLTSGVFMMAKALAGDGAAKVPGETEFTVNYSYPAGIGFEAGSGSLVLLADGTVVSSEELPFGAVVTFEEADLPSIDGIEWGTPEFSMASVTIGASEAVSITLTNTATVPTVPAPTPTESTSTTSPAPTVTPSGKPGVPRLPQTGGEWAGVLTVVLTVIAGATAVVARRRSSR